MMFFIMARISDPLVPRAIFGVLNTLLFFPSGAVYPIAGFPKWLRVDVGVRSVHVRGPCFPHAAA
jgi:ABC-2 type transport system permease protein